MNYNYRKRLIASQQERNSWATVIILLNRRYVSLHIYIKKKVGRNKTENLISDTQFLR
jgi:hypothetical protein